MRTVEILRELIERSPNWTQNKIANKLGVSSQNMSNKMNTKGAPKADFVAKVLSVLGYRLVVIPDGTKLPAGAIEITPGSESVGAQE